MKLLSFGEVLFDVYPDKACIGGAPLNLAAHFSILGGESYIMSATGKDELGQKALEETRKMGVHTKYVMGILDKETGKCIVSLDENQIPSYNLKEDVAYDYIDFDSLDEDFDIFAFGTLALREKNNFSTVSKIIKSKKCRKIYTDLNIRAPFYSKESILLCLENSHITKISDEELPVVCELVFGEIYDIDEAFIRLKEKFENLEIIIITAGSKGAYAYDTMAKTKYFCESQKVEVVSTVGAGDSFGATFLYKYFSGCDLKISMEYASKISGFVVSNKEAIPNNMKEFLDNLK